MYELENEKKLHITNDRLIEQLGSLVPQIHLTMVSVLQSLALVFLLNSLSISPPTGFQIPSIVHAFLVHHLYLPHIMSFMIIIIIWNEFAYVTILLHRPLSAFTTSLQFLLTMAEIAVFDTVDSIGKWLFWIGITSLLGYYIRRRNNTSTDYSLFSNKLMLSAYQVYDNNVTFLIIGLLSPCIGILRETVPLNLSIIIFGNSLNIFDFIVPLILIIIGLWIMVRNNQRYIKMMQMILTGPYTVTQGGAIQEKK